MSQKTTTPFMGYDGEHEITPQILTASGIPLPDSNSTVVSGEKRTKLIGRYCHWVNRGTTAAGRLSLFRRLYGIIQNFPPGARVRSKRGGEAKLTGVLRYAQIDKKNKFVAIVDWPENAIDSNGKKIGGVLSLQNIAVIPD